MSPSELLHLAAPLDSEFFAFLQEVYQLGVDFPAILDAVDADLDLHGQRKKA